MAMIDIISEHDPRVQVTFNVPIKGRQNPLIFTVPMIQYFPREKTAEFQVWYKKGVADNTLTNRQAALKMLELNVSAKDYAVLEKCADGVLVQISDKWEEASRVEVGESSASSDT